MASRVCPYCEKTSHMTARYYSDDNANAHFSERLNVAYSCHNCARISSASLATESNFQSLPNADNNINSAEPDWDPKVVLGKNFPDVPDYIAAVASEAYMCQSIDAPHAAILLARSVIEAAAKYHGIEKGFLAEKIKKLQEKGLVRPLVAEAAEGVKDIGNDMAHGDIKVAVTGDDVEETLMLMSVVLEEVFQVDARTKSLRERVAARKSKPEASVGSVPREQE